MPESYVNLDFVFRWKVCSEKRLINSIFCGRHRAVCMRVFMHQKLPKCWKDECGVSAGATPEKSWHMQIFLYCKNVFVLMHCLSVNVLKSWKDECDVLIVWRPHGANPLPWTKRKLHNMETLPHFEKYIADITDNPYIMKKDSIHKGHTCLFLILIYFRYVPLVDPFAMSLTFVLLKSQSKLRKVMMLASLYWDTGRSKNSSW